VRKGAGGQREARCEVQTKNFQNKSQKLRELSGPYTIHVHSYEVYFFVYQTASKENHPMITPDVCHLVGYLYLHVNKIVSEVTKVIFKSAYIHV
jgi:hypothetical protein